MLRKEVSQTIQILREICILAATKMSAWVRCWGVTYACSQDWEDSHGETETKYISQHMLLPHDIVGSFLHEGETRRMTGLVSWL